MEYFNSNDEKMEVFRRLTDDELQKLRVGCSDPSDGGCMGVYCDSCTARNVLRERK